jgi:formamidopyrimidine-DNA glycosylase
VPELAEVEYFRKRWDHGVGQRVIAVQLHPEKRVFRGTAVDLLRRQLPGSVLIGSEARGKQLLFRFSNDLWLGVHLGRSGKLSEAAPHVVPGKHDHLVLVQRERALLFTDPRLFGRVHFHSGSAAPGWWSKLPAPVNSREFTRAKMDRFIQRHPRLPIKGILLLQAGFPGVGNWMADEILWRAKINPRTPGGRLDLAQITTLWRALRFVCRGALKSVAVDFSDPPRNWFFHQRWDGKGLCPQHQVRLERETIAGRTTVWCDRCQP